MLLLLVYVKIWGVGIVVFYFSVLRILGFIFDGEVCYLLLLFRVEEEIFRYFKLVILLINIGIYIFFLYFERKGR